MHLLCVLITSLPRCFYLFILLRQFFLSLRYRVIVRILLSFPVFITAKTINLIRVFVLANSEAINCCSYFTIISINNAKRNITRPCPFKHFCIINVLGRSIHKLHITPYINCAKRQAAKGRVFNIIVMYRNRKAIHYET
jgi:hypothetical protein